MPGGVRIQFTTMAGHFTSLHDETIEALTLELCLPLDETGDQFLRSLGQLGEPD